MDYDENYDIPERLDLRKRYCKTVARELRYDHDVIDAIEKATSVYEIDRIMITARRNKT